MVNDGVAEVNVDADSDGEADAGDALARLSFFVGGGPPSSLKDAFTILSVSLSSHIDTCLMFCRAVVWLYWCCLKKKAHTCILSLESPEHVEIKVES